MWYKKLQSIYDNFQEFELYCESYGLNERLGYTNIIELWNDNPMIQGSVNPADYGIVKHSKNKMLVTYNNRDGNTQQLECYTIIFLNDCIACEVKEKLRTKRMKYIKFNDVISIIKK